MEACYLEFAKFNIESLYEHFKHVLAFTHELLGLLLSHYTVFALFRHLEIREDYHKDLS